eukprot:CAMPEP_0168435480 /NCGR_PEP_ID=MMETSP0228-20121227/40436_1 /TAXON_ID=133427 /ORGANISM="Protoceratium reticulatum, Strain CCCM 535 (=CCMP 1889)" /LENGTH=279 /DNA_ID=CAMNT_0008449655 /DNA_START=42 /DNA_END=879 /DNA_ORIENTATION=-
MTLGDIQALWRQMLEAVQAVHGETRELPGGGGRLKLIDFGIAKRIASETTNISRDATVGTISYMAPEAVRHGAVKLGRSADVWSLGIILYQLAYRRSPFAHLEPVQRLFALSDPDVDIEFPSGHRLESHSTETKALLVDALGRCLQREPGCRASVPQLLEHGFLRDSVRLMRGPFDRALEAMVAGFFEVAREVICAGSEGDDPEPGHAGCGRWQALADDIWDRHGRRRPPAFSPAAAARAAAAKASAPTGPAWNPSASASRTGSHVGPSAKGPAAVPRW